MSALAAALALVWLALAARLARERHRAPALPPPLPPGAAPPTVVLLPLRDEEANAADCLATLAAQTAPLRRVAIDDGSRDRTPEILAELAQRAPLTVLSAPPPAAGASGKLNALAYGLAALPAEERAGWLLTTDADTRHAPDLLARAHAALAERRLDALSLAGRQAASGAGDALLTPAVFALLDLLLGDWRPYADGRAERPLANGQFFLLRGTALAAVGGFEAFARQPLDDVALAAALARRGFRVGFLRAEDGLTVRMYSALGAALAGWRRNLTLFLGDRPGSAAAVHLLVAATVGLAAALLARGALLAAFLLWLGGAVASAWARRSAGSRGAWGFLFPLDVLLLAMTLALARLDRSRGRVAPWRGRTLQPPG